MFLAQQKLDITTKRPDHSPNMSQHGPISCLYRALHASFGQPQVNVHLGTPQSCLWRVKSSNLSWIVWFWLSRSRDTKSLKQKHCMVLSILRWFPKLIRFGHPFVHVLGLGAGNPRPWQCQGLNSLICNCLLIQVWLTLKHGNTFAHWTGWINSGAPSTCLPSQPTYQCASQWKNGVSANTWCSFWK